jgi:hypothetical protein
LAAERSPRLRPLAMSDVLDELFVVYRRGFGTFMAITALVQVPTTLVSLPFLTATSRFAELLGETADTIAAFDVFDAVSAVSLALTLGVGLVGQLLLLAAICSATAVIYLGDTPTVAAAYQLALTRFWRLLRLSLLVAVGLVVLTLLGFGPIIFPALLCFSLPAVVVVTLYFATNWSLSVPTLVLEDTSSALAALRRSHALVRPAWWRTFGTLVVLSALVGVLQLIAAGLIESVISLVQVAVAPGALARPIWLGVVSALLQTVAGVLSGPLFYIGLTLIYYDRRVRAEGYDLTVLARDLAESPPHDG